MIISQDKFNELYGNTNNTQNVSVTTDKQPSFVSQIVGGIAKPFVKTYMSAAGALQGIGTGIGSLATSAYKGETAQQAKDRLAKTLGQSVKTYGEANLPMVGNVKAVGNTNNILDFTKDVLGTGSELGSYFVGAGAAKPVIGALKTGVGQAIKQTVPIGIASGALGMAGSEMQKDEATPQSVFSSGVAGAALSIPLSIALPIATHLVGGTVKTGVKAIKAIGEGVKKREAGLFGIFTGDSAEMIEKGLNNPTMFDKGLEGGDEALRKMVTAGQENSKTLLNDFKSNYVNELNKLTSNNTEKLIGTKQLLQDFADTLESKNIKIKKVGNNYKLDFTTADEILNSGEAANIQRVYDALRKWDRGYDLKGLDELQNFIYKAAKFPQEGGGTSKSPLLGQFGYKVGNIIKDSIDDPVTKKKYIELNDVFSKQIGLYQDLFDAFNSGNPFSKLAGAFNKNADNIRQLMNFYEEKTGEDVLSAVAGREISLRKPAAFSFLNPRSWIDVIVLPKQQGKIISGIAKLQQKLKPASSIKLK